MRSVHASLEEASGERSSVEQQISASRYGSLLKISDDCGLDSSLRRLTQAACRIMLPIIERDIEAIRQAQIEAYALYNRAKCEHQVVTAVISAEEALVQQEATKRVQREEDQAFLLKCYILEHGKKTV